MLTLELCGPVVLYIICGILYFTFNETARKGLYEDESHI